ncbi:hypothetical protein J6590_089640 [Homalodisca vitripennis]|nr:hypothetical protein J6590_089640 [Homalodisca vitripennis]
MLNTGTLPPFFIALSDVSDITPGNLKKVFDEEAQDEHLHRVNINTISGSLVVSSSVRMSPFDTVGIAFFLQSLVQKSSIMYRRERNKWCLDVRMHSIISLSVTCEVAGASPTAHPTIDIESIPSQPCRGICD